MKNSKNWNMIPLTFNWKLSFNQSILLKTILLALANSLFALATYAQCSTFDIAVESNSVCAPKIVRFNITNAPANATFNWNIGHGQTAGADSIYGYYNEPRVINASVEIRFPNGEVCFIRKDSALVINEQPKPIFSISRDKLCNGPDTISLVDRTPNVLIRNWVVDGTSYNNASKNLVHSFVTTGKKNILLITTDSNGCQGVGSVKDAVEVFPNLKFDFKASITDGCLPLQTKFSINTNPITPFAKSYSWHFDAADNENSTLEEPTASRYSAPGKHTASLFVSTSNGCNYEITKPNYIKVGDTLDLNLTLEDTAYCLQDTIRLKQAIALKGGTTQWYLTGTLDTLQGITNYSSFIVPKNIGLLTIKLVHNFNNCISQKVYTDTIVVRGVRADFTSMDRYHCEIPHTVHLQNITNKLDAQTVNYTWLIKENGAVKYTSSQMNDSFTFNKLPATYDVQLIAAGDNGCIDTMTKYNYIYQDNLNLDFDALPEIGCIGQEIKFVNRTKPSSYLSSDQFEWYFKDLDHTTDISKSFLRNPTVTYSDTGFYDVLLIGKNGINCRDTLRINNAVRIIIPELKFDVDKDILCLGEKFKFTGLTKPVEANFSHKWELIHVNSQNKITYLGTTANGVPTKAGEYKLIYTHSILGGCVDSDSIPLYVNGISATILLDTNNGCAPLEVNPQALITNNYNFGETSDSVYYMWNVNAKDGAVLSYANTATPNAKFILDGDYKLQLQLTNAAGCTNNVVSGNITIGVKSDFTLNKSVLCLGDNLIVKDRTASNTAILDWEILKDVGSVENSLPNKEYSFSVPEEGEYTIQQIVHRDMLCFDTLTKPFRVIKVVASFTSTDTFLVCAPVFVQFQSQSRNADSLSWDFGDGTREVTKSNYAGHVYEKNSGSDDGFDIKLIAQSKYGCSDTLIKEDYNFVKGPVPYFTPSNTTGCEPLEVNFKNQSEDAVKSILYYNDGTSPDYSDQPNYTFKHVFRSNPDSTVTRFNIDLITYDSLGCAASYSLQVPITINKSPDIKLLQSITNNGCVPFNLTAADTSNTASSWNWAVDTFSNFGDSLLDFRFTNFGEYNIQLVSKNKADCSDTLRFTLVAKETPRVNFEENDSLCKDKIALFNGQVSSTNPLNQVFWNFGESAYPVQLNSSMLQAATTYLSRGQKEVNFTAVLANGCSASILKNVFVSDNLDIDTSHMKYVSFNENSELEIHYYQNEYTKFNHYIIQKSGTEWKKEFDRNTLLAIDHFETMPTDSACYDVSVQDYCDFIGEKSTKHCFISLSSTGKEHSKITLNWTPYVGWEYVRDYQIFRSTNGVDFKLLVKLGGDVLTYTDINLCDLEYTYYVLASHPFETFESHSNRLATKPVYIYNTSISSIKNVSVVDQNQLEITWNKSPYEGIDVYQLHKFNSNGNYMLDEFELNDTSYVDFDVSVDEESYMYTVTEKDKCGYINESGRYGKSIVLKGNYINEKVTTNESRLWWNRYEDWEFGVKNYQIVLFDVPQTRIIGTTISDTHFIDPEYHEKIKEEYCYQVYAINQIGDTSYSNVVCVSGKSSIQIPTAFSPNEDGLNDNFKPVTQFVKQSEFGTINHYLFTIYNRWGEKIFETNDLNNGWNGIYNDVPCQNGVYLFTISIKSLAGYVTNYSGTVTVIR